MFVFPFTTVQIDYTVSHNFYFAIGNSPFFNIEKFLKFLNSSRLITPYEISFFLSFFFLFKNFSQIFKIFLRRRKFREICSHPIRGCSLILSREWQESRPMESNRLISYRLMERPILFQGGFLTILLFYATFLRDTPSCQLVYWIYSQ